MAKYKVVVTDPGYKSYESERRICAAAGAELAGPVVWKTQAELVAGCQGAHGLLVRQALIDRALIETLPELKVIARYGIGVDNVDLAAATRAKIVVTNVPDYCVDEVSDHGLALFLALARRVVAADQAVKGGAWDVVAHKGIQRLRGQTLGLLGFGKIARALAVKAQALGMQVVAVDPFVDAETMARLKVRAADMDTMLAESDAVSIHVPLSPETRGIIGDRTLARMKPTAFLINTSRGGLVDEQALAAALTKGRLAGAALDVMEKEPPPSDHPLRTAPNVIFTPHLAFYSQEAVVELQTKVAEEAARAFRGEPPRSPVNRDVLKAR
jgi:D-3-phosphoglycerate dehydrogenase